MLTYLIAEAANSTAENSDGGNAFLGFVCIGVICLICYAVGKSANKYKGHDRYIHEKVRPKK